MMFYLFHEDDQFCINGNFKESEDNTDVFYGDCNLECDGGKANYKIQQFASKHNRKHFLASVYVCNGAFEISNGALAVGSVIDLEVQKRLLF